MLSVHYCHHCLISYSFEFLSSFSLSLPLSHSHSLPLSLSVFHMLHFSYKLYCSVALKSVEFDKYHPNNIRRKTPHFQNVSSKGCLTCAHREVQEMHSLPYISFMVFVFCADFWVVSTTVCTRRSLALCCLFPQKDCQWSCQQRCFNMFPVLLKEHWSYYCDDWRTDIEGQGWEERDFLSKFCIKFWLLASWFVQAAITKYHRLGWLIKNRNLVFCTSEGWKSKIRVHSSGAQNPHCIFA